MKKNRVASSRSVASMDRWPAELRTLLQSAAMPRAPTPLEQARSRIRLRRARESGASSGSRIWPCWLHPWVPWLLVPLCALGLYILPIQRWISPPSSTMMPEERGAMTSSAGRWEQAPERPKPADPWFYTPNRCTQAVCGHKAACCLEAWDSTCDDLLVEVAMLRDDESKTSSRLGRCYVHDQSACPQCACPYYIKVVQASGESVGYDYGTGCVQDRASLISELKAFCMTARCE